MISNSTTPVPQTTQAATQKTFDHKVSSLTKLAMTSAIVYYVSIILTVFASMNDSMSEMIQASGLFRTVAYFNQPTYATLMIILCCVVTFCDPLARICWTSFRTKQLVAISSLSMFRIRFIIPLVIAVILYQYTQQQEHFIKMLVNDQPMSRQLLYWNMACLSGLIILAIVSLPIIMLSVPVKAGRPIHLSGRTKLNVMIACFVGIFTWNLFAIIIMATYTILYHYASQLVTYSSQDVFEDISEKESCALFVAMAAIWLAATTTPNEDVIKLKATLSANDSAYVVHIPVGNNKERPVLLDPPALPIQAEGTVGVHMVTMAQFSPFRHELQPTIQRQADTQTSIYRFVIMLAVCLLVWVYDTSTWDNIQRAKNRAARRQCIKEKKQEAQTDHAQPDLPSIS